MDESKHSNPEHRPSHYIEVNPESNRFADIVGRMRVFGPWEVNTSVAFEKLTAANPDYCLNRKFVRQLLEIASRVSPLEHDEWLREVARDSWTYDCPDPQPKFDDYFVSLKLDIYRPDYDKVLQSDSQVLFAIEGLPGLYMFHEITRVEGFDDPIIDSRHFLDLGPVVAPVSLPDHNGTAYYIL